MERSDCGRPYTLTRDKTGKPGYELRVYGKIYILLYDPGRREWRRYEIDPNGFGFQIGESTYDRNKQALIDSVAT